MKVKNKYKNFLQTRTGIDKYNAFKTILYSDNDTLTETLFKKDLRNLNLGKSISICDVGGGDGKRIVDLAKKINNHFYCNIHLDFIEQSDLMCSDFKTNSKELKKFCEIEIHTSEVEETFLEGEYDIVFLIHSIFCFPDFSVFCKILDRVKDGGVLYVVSNSADSFLARLKQELDFQYEDRRYEIKDLLSDLHLQNIPYTKHSFTTRWALNSHEVDKKLLDILEWLSLGEFQSYNPQRQAQLKKTAKERAIKDMNQFFFSEREDVVVICK